MALNLHFAELISWRFPKSTNPCRNLKIFMEENLLKKNCNGSAICCPISKTLKDEKNTVLKKVSATYYTLKTAVKERLSLRCWRKVIICSGWVEGASSASYSPLLTCLMVLWS